MIEKFLSARGRVFGEAVTIKVVVIDESLGQRHVKYFLQQIDVPGESSTGHSG
jgi:hypothetical protein